MIVIADGKVTEVASRNDNHENLWLKLEELPAATGWQVKPEGACRGELCVPLPEAKRAEWLVDADGSEWLDYSEFAGLIGQKQARDGDVWSLSSIPEVRRSGLEQAIAPDFEVTERNGDTLRLSDLRGHKVVLFTWASW